VGERVAVTTTSGSSSEGAAASLSRGAGDSAAGALPGDRAIKRAMDNNKRIRTRQLKGPATEVNGKIGRWAAERERVATSHAGAKL
jgi:hypothetical protein